jgi:hypothetical protein
MAHHPLASHAAPALLVLGLAFVSAPAAAQTITLAEGTAASLQIVSLPESNPNGPGTVVANGVEFVGIEVTGRTLAQEHDATANRRLVRHGIARVELRQGGRLFRYKRGGGQFWGFLHVAADGSARVVLELPGTGPGQLADPFCDRIGVGTDGLHAAVTLLAGGIHVVRLDGGVFASTGRADRLAVPVGFDVQEASVMVGPTAMFYQGGTVDHLYRCGLADGGVPVDVSPPSVPNGEFKDQMALSRDGAVLVLLYGPDNQQRLWRVGTTGPATVLPPPPSKYEEPGYLPEDPGEPAMLLDDDGSRVFFIVADVRDELHLLDMQGVLPSLQITSDPIFQPYIGVSILPKFAADTLTIAIGDAGQMDWFRATLTPQGGTVVNLSATGSPTAPFPAGTLNPVQAADAGGDLLVADQQAGGLALRRLDLQGGGLATLHANLLSMPESGSATPGVADLLVRTSTGDSLYTGATGALFATAPAGVLLTPPVHGPSFAATWVHLVNGWGAAFFYLPDGTLVSGPFEYDLKQLTLTAIGGIVAIGTPLRYLSPGVYVVMNRPAVPLRLCLSGAGA